jgi:hypothetical protein
MFSAHQRTTRKHPYDLNILFISKNNFPQINKQTNKQTDSLRKVTLGNYFYGNLIFITRKIKYALLENNFIKYLVLGSKRAVSES